MRDGIIMTVFTYLIVILNGLGWVFLSMVNVDAVCRLYARGYGSLDAVAAFVLIPILAFAFSVGAPTWLMRIGEGELARGVALLSLLFWACYSLFDAGLAAT